MRQKSPIEELVDRIKYLASSDILMSDDVLNFDFLHLKQQIYIFCKSEINKNEFKLVVEKHIISNFKLIVIDLDSLFSKAKKRPNLTSPEWNLYYETGMPLEKVELSVFKEQIQKEIDCYRLLFEVFDIDIKSHAVSKTIITKVSKPLSKSPGRKASIYCFKGDKKLTEVTTRTLFNLILLGLKKEELFDLDRSSSEDDFYKITQLKDIASVSGKAFYFNTENHFVAFVFKWLEINGYCNSAFTMIEKAKCFFSSHETLLTANILNKSLRHAELITKSKPAKINNNPPEYSTSSAAEYFEYLNNFLHYSLS